MKKVSAWQSYFAGHTTRVAFNLTLSRRMVSLLHLVRDTQYREQLVALSVAIPMVQHPTCLNLVKRGLIEFKLTDNVKTCRYVLTPAGEKVVELLVLAGLIPKHKTVPQLMERA